MFNKLCFLAGFDIINCIVPTRITEFRFRVFGAFQKNTRIRDLFSFFRAGVVGCSLVLRSPDEARLAEAVERLRAIVAGFGVEPLDEYSG